MEETLVYSKTWERTADVISKVGFMDGAADGQKASFQRSFDLGYQLGFNFGLAAGFNKAQHRARQQNNEDRASDPRRINCQICLSNVNPQDNVVNMYNIQKERNNAFLLQITKDNR